MRRLVLSAAVLLAGCGHVYVPTSRHAAAAAGATLRAERVGADQRPLTSLSPRVTEIGTELRLDSREPVSIREISLAAAEEQRCGEGPRVRHASRIGPERERRVLGLVRTAVVHPATPPHEAPAGSSKLVLGFDGRDAVAEGPHAIDVVLASATSNEAQCVRVRLQGGDPDARWVERPRRFVGLRRLAGYSRSSGTVHGRTGLWGGRWIGPVRAGLEYSLIDGDDVRSAFAAGGEILAARWRRVGVATAVAYEVVTPDENGAQHGPRAGVRCEWLPAASGWRAFRDHPASSAIGLELLVGRWWGADRAPDSWVFSAGIAAYLGR